MPSGAIEKWEIAFLMDTIFTRDTWMHRGDIARATGRELVLTPDHDGRIVADAVADWARRHGQPFRLVLDGPAGGEFMRGKQRRRAATRRRGVLPRPLRAWTRRRTTRTGGAVLMETTTDEIADGIYRFSTYIPEMDFMFNQFLVKGEEPLLFHCGPRQMFPLVSDAMARVIPVEQLKWITFGHVEADECGSMNNWLAAAPDATVAHTAVGCMVSVDDMADRPPRPLEHGEVIDLGGKRVRHLTTPHVPHGWDAGLYFEETTGTLLCGDLFSAVGASPALTTGDIVGPAIAAEDMFLATSLTPATAPTIRSLADLEPRTLAVMHGPSFNGDTVPAIHDARRRLRGAAPCRDGRGRVSVGVWRIRSANCNSCSGPASIDAGPRRFRTSWSSPAASPSGRARSRSCLRESLSEASDGVRVEIVSSDGFLFPNRVLDARGLAMRKGFPESYDRDALLAFLAAVKAR